MGHVRGGAGFYDLVAATRAAGRAGGRFHPATRFRSHRSGCAGHRGRPGIGRDLARALAACGAHVLAGVRDPDAADVAWTAPGGGRVGPLRLDVTDVPGTRDAVDAAVATLGRIDILVNNAGLGANHDALDVREADWDEMMAVNLKGVFFA